MKFKIFQFHQSILQCQKAELQIQSFIIFVFVCYSAIANENENENEKFDSMQELFFFKAKHAYSISMKKSS